MGIRPDHFIAVASAKVRQERNDLRDYFAGQAMVALIKMHREERPK